MRHLKVLGMALVAVMTIVAFMSVAAPAQFVPAAAPIADVEQAALVGLSTCLFAAIGAMTFMTWRVEKQKEKTMTNCYVSSETRDITNNPITESPNNTKTVGHFKRDLGNHCYIGSIDQQQPANEKANEKRHLTFRLAEACV